MVKTPQVGTVSVEEEPGFWQPCTWLISSFHEKELGNEAELQAFFFLLLFFSLCTQLISSFHEKELGNEAELQAIVFLLLLFFSLCTQLPNTG